MTPQNKQTEPLAFAVIRRFVEVPKYVALILGLVTVVFAVVSAFFLAKIDPGRPAVDRSEFYSFVSSLNDLSLRLDSTKKDVENLQRSIQDISKNQDATTALQLKNINTSLTETQNKLSNLEQVILDNPSKVLAMPLLRKDLDDMKLTHQTNANSIKEQIDRVYDLNKWFLGLMITSSVAIIGLAISNFFKKPSG